MSYSFDKTNIDRWSDLADTYHSMIDELNNEDLESVFISVPAFDVYEVL